MLRELRIKNLAIIDDLSIEFDRGLNILTGETGAGKSIIIHALSLALGERASGDVIRTGEKEAVVEALFDIPSNLFDRSTLNHLKDMGINIEDGIILKRVIPSNGRGRAYINNSLATIQNLSGLSRTIIDIHGQYEHQSLLSPEVQLKTLDAYGGLLEERQEMKDLYERLTHLKREISALTEKERERAQRIDLLRYQINDIERAHLRVGEEDELIEEEKILSNALRLKELANQAYGMLYLSDTSCITNLKGVITRLREIANIDGSAKDALRSIEDAMPLLEEASYFLRDYREGLDLSPERLDAIQERLHLISNLKRKYGDTISDILRYKEEAVAELNELENSGERLETLRAEIEGLRKTLTERAHRLSERRREVARDLEQQVIKELSMLSMKDSQFSIHIIHEEGEDTTDGLKATPSGIDHVEFLISPNKGERLRPLSKIASGGELSRIMLALKGLLSRGDNIPVLIFDEIDAGIGGMAAGAVGRRLKELSRDHQVICITHLPQIASYADHHLCITKGVRGKRTSVQVKRVEGEERVREIARMLSGDISEASIRHAEEMLRLSAKSC